MNQTSASPENNFPKGTFYFLIAAIFLTGIGFGITGPVLPFLIQKYISNPSHAAATISWLTSAYAICAFFAAPILGTLSDRFGRKPILAISFIGSIIGYITFGIGGALWVLFLGRILDGLTAGNFGTIFSMVSDSTPRQDLPKVFGQLGGASGAGFLLGPVFGGLLAKISLETPFFVAAALTCIIFIWGYFFVPETHKPQGSAKKLEWSSFNPLLKIGELFTMPQIRLLIIALAIFTIPFVFLQTNVGLLIKDSLSWGPEQISLIFSMVGVCDIIVQGVLLGFLLKYLGENKVLVLGLGLVFAAMIGLALLPTMKMMWLIVVAVAAFAVGEGIFSNTLRGIMAKHTPAGKQGQVQGGGQSLNSLMQAISPSIGGQLYSKVSAGAPFWMGTVLVLFSAAFVWMGERTAGKLKTQEA